MKGVLSVEINPSTFTNNYVHCWVHVLTLLQNLFYHMIRGVDYHTAGIKIHVHSTFKKNQIKCPQVEISAPIISTCEDVTNMPWCYPI